LGYGLDYEMWRFDAGLYTAQNKYEYDYWNGQFVSGDIVNSGLGLSFGISRQLGYYTHFSLRLFPEFVVFNEFKPSYQFSNLVMMSIDYKLKFSKEKSYPFW